MDPNQDTYLVPAVVVTAPRMHVPWVTVGLGLLAITLWLAWKR